MQPRQVEPLRQEARVGELQGEVPVQEGPWDEGPSGGGVLPEGPTAEQQEGERQAG